VGLTARQGSRATGATVARVLVLPWLVWVGVMVLLETGRGVSAGMVEGGFYLTLWVAIALINNALFLVWSRVRLGRDLRTLASERYGGGGLSWWFRADSSSASGPG
jgi:hypothetical protein